MWLVKPATAAATNKIHALRAHPDQLAHRAQMVILAPMERKVLPEQSVWPAIIKLQRHLAVASSAHPDPRARPDPLELPDPLDRKADPVTKAVMANPAAAVPDQLAKQAPREHQVRRVPKERTEPMAKPEAREPLVQPEPREMPVQLARTATLVLLANQAPLVLPDHPDQQAAQAKQATKDLPARPAPKAPMARMPSTARAHAVPQPQLRNIRSVPSRHQRPRIELNIRGSNFRNDTASSYPRPTFLVLNWIRSVHAPVVQSVTSLLAHSFFMLK